MYTHDFWYVRILVYQQDKMYTGQSGQELALTGVRSCGFTKILSVVIFP